MNDVEFGDPRRRLIWLLPILTFVMLFVFLGRDLVTFWLNLSEFGELFIKPVYFGLLGGLVLAVLALFRIDVKNRRSLTWWGLSLALGLIRAKDESQVSPIWFDFDGFKLSHQKFFAWQITKVLLGTLFFTKLMFGMAVDAIIRGWKPGLETLSGIFALPFVTPSLEMAYAEAHVIPMMPSLTLLVSPILYAVGVRLMFSVVATQIARIAATMFSAHLLGREIPDLSRFVSIIEALGAVLLLWFAFNLFFSSFIDYNTRYLILGLGAAGMVLAIFAILDRRMFREGRWAVWVPIVFQRRIVTTRLAPLVLIALATVSVALVNNSIADARKVEWLGPYTAQHISVNRYLAELDKVQELPYEFGLTSIPPGQIDRFIDQNRELLSKVRLWDQQGSFDKLRPEIGLIPYVDFTESDILRFTDSLYWSASMDLILPTTVKSEDRWYATHFVYTHVPSGLLTLEGHKGRIVDASMFFQQRRIYYGEGGLFRDTWVAFPVGRTSSSEVGGHLYAGRGGVTVSPPLSWIFEPNFIFSYPTTSMRVLRYRDIHDRMRLLFPYFTYSFDRQRVDTWPVTDGENTYWAMPLILFLDAGRVPWSGGNPLERFVGYALIDVYHGDIELIILGDDYFSQLFKTVYSEHVSTEVPEWLKPQLRYPEELFEWRIGKYNFFHITDPATYITAKEFYTVPQGLDTYYILAQPPSFEKLEFIGLLSLELRGALGENLAGYAVVRNDYPHTGEMVFYKVPLEARTKLLGPTAVSDALERNSEFAQLRTLLRNPRTGNQIFYKIGDYDVFFIPVYTAPGGGVVTELGTIATVGADFVGEYYVSLGSTIEASFRGFLAKIAGVEAPPPEPELGEKERVEKLISTLDEAGLKVLRPTAINPDISFLEGSAKYLSEEDWNQTRILLNSFLELCDAYDASRVFMWKPDSRVNFGIMVQVEEIIELHYIIVELT